MKKLFNLFIIILFMACKNENFIDYIEKGFVKPSIEDAHFSLSNLGDNNRIYVPSEQEIEVEFTIKNKYQKEITGTLEIEEGKKDAFNVIPYIKSLTPTKMIIAFNFKKEEEPSVANGFLGTSVPINLSIYEKKNARFLSNQIINANCNTPPDEISNDKITYDEERDEYIVVFPQKAGKHQDLKEIQFFLSSALGEENVSPKIVPIDGISQNVTLVVKGNEEWQLKQPQGNRTLKTVVYDKAGLKSTEIGNTTNRIFTNITLVPPSIDVSLTDLKQNGVNVPTIKELKEFISDEKKWKEAGYEIEYQSNNFSYDNKKNIFKPISNLGEGEYNIVVILKQNGSNLANKQYIVTVIGDHMAGVKESDIAITDETKYKELLPPDGVPALSLSVTDWQNNGDVREGSVLVPYTDFETKIKVHVESVTSLGTIKDENQIGNDNFKDFEVTLDKEQQRTKILTFFAFSSDGSRNKKYKIKFIRKPSVEITFKANIELFPLTSNSELSMSWLYRAQRLNLNSVQEIQMTVAKGARVTFSINPGTGGKVKEFASSDVSHTGVNIPNNGGNIELVAERDFSLSVTLRAETTFQWIDIGERNSKGYLKAHVQYYLNNEQKTIERQSGTIPETVIQKDKVCKFYIEGLDENYRVLGWKVNSEDITQSTALYTLNPDKTSLTINNPDTNYVVKIFTGKLCELELQVVNEIGNIILDHGYSFEVRKHTGTGTLINPDSSGKYVGIFPNTQVYITAIEGSDSNYEIADWQKKTEDESSFSIFSVTSGINERNFNIRVNTIVRLILRKKSFNLSWSIENGDKTLTTIEAKVNDIPIPNTQTTSNTEVGGKIELKVTNIQDGRIIKGWKIDGALYTSSNVSKNLTLSWNKTTLTITNIRAETNIVLVLETKTYTIQIEIQKPQGATEDHGYTIEATNKNSPINANYGTKYTYSNIAHDDESNLNFKAVSPSNPAFLIDKWQYWDGSRWEDTDPALHYKEPNNPEILKWSPTKDMKLKLVLKKSSVRFTLIRKGGNGKLEIRKTYGGTPTVISLHQTPVDIPVEATGKELHLKVEGLTPSTKILSWKLNGSERKDLFLRPDGFWKGEGEDGKFTHRFNPNDEVEVTVGEVNFVVFDVKGDSGFWNGDYKISIRKTEGQTDDNILLPIKDEIIINKDAPHGNGGSQPRPQRDRTIYATQGTKINVEMKDLDNSKEIWSWKTHTSLLDGTWNDNHTQADLILGKYSIENYLVSKNVSAINAIIRDKTFLIDVGTVPSGNEGSLISEVGANSLNLKLYELESGSTFQEVVSTKATIRLKYRIKKGTKLQIEVDDKSNKCHYYFYEWQVGGVINASNKAVNPFQFDLMQDVELNALVLPKLKVKVHKITESIPNVSTGNRDSCTKIELLNIDDNDVESANLGNHGAGVNSTVDKIFNKKLSELGMDKYKVRITFILPTGYINPHKIKTVIWKYKKDIPSLAQWEMISSEFKDGKYMATIDNIKYLLELQLEKIEVNP